MAPSSSSASWGSAKVTAGSSRTTAPNSSSCRINSPACSGARVTTTRRPASGFASVPVNVSSHQSQDTVCASGQQGLRQLAAQILRMLRKAGSAQANVIGTVNRKHACVEDQFLPLNAGPGPQRHLAAAFQFCQERSLPGYSGARLGVVERSEEHTSELQSRPHLVCRLLLEKKKDILRRQRRVSALPRSTSARTPASP